MESRLRIAVDSLDLSFWAKLVLLVLLVLRSNFHSAQEWHSHDTLLMVDFFATIFGNAATFIYFYKLKKKRT